MSMPPIRTARAVLASPIKAKSHGQLQDAGWVLKEVDDVLSEPSVGSKRWEVKQFKSAEEPDGWDADDHSQNDLNFAKETEVPMASAKTRPFPTTSFKEFSEELVETLKMHRDEIEKSISRELRQILTEDKSMTDRGKPWAAPCAAPLPSLAEDNDDDDDCSVLRQLASLPTKGSMTQGSMAQSKSRTSLRLSKKQLVPTQDVTDRLQEILDASGPEGGRICGGMVKKVVQNSYFEIVTSLVMLLNAAVIAVEANWEMQNYNKESEPVFYILDLAFNVMFTIELLLRLACDGCFFTSRSNPALGWNALDTILVGSSWLKEIFVLASADGDSEGTVNVSSLRLVRMLRLVRIARLLRVVRFFSELRIMVYGILGSAKSLLWALILMMLVMFVMGVTLMQLVNGHLRDLWENDKTEQLDAAVQAITPHFGTLARTILTLFGAISGGLDWSDASEPLSMVHEVIEWIFAAYIFFTMFCCLNVITAIFVENAKSMKLADDDAMHTELMAEHRVWIIKVAELFSKVATGNDGTFTFGEFSRELTSNPRVQTCFEKLGIDVHSHDPADLWEMFDADGSGNIDIDEFATGMKHLQGYAKSIEVYKIRKDARRIMQLMHKLEDELHGIRTRVSGKSPKSAWRSSVQVSEMV